MRLQEWSKSLSELETNIKLRHLEEQFRLDEMAHSVQRQMSEAAARLAEEKRRLAESSAALDRKRQSMEALSSAIHASASDAPVPIAKAPAKLTRGRETQTDPVEQLLPTRQDRDGLNSDQAAAQQRYFKAKLNSIMDEIEVMQSRLGQQQEEYQRNASEQHRYIHSDVEELRVQLTESARSEAESLKAKLMEAARSEVESFREKEVDAVRCEIIALKSQSIEAMQSELHSLRAQSMKAMQSDVAELRATAIREEREKVLNETLQLRRELAAEIEEERQRAADIRDKTYEELENLRRATALEIDKEKKAWEELRDQQSREIEALKEEQNRRLLAITSRENQAEQSALRLAEERRRISVVAALGYAETSVRIALHEGVSAIAAAKASENILTEYDGLSRKVKGLTALVQSLNEHVDHLEKRELLRSDYVKGLEQRIAESDVNTERISAELAGCKLSFGEEIMSKQRDLEGALVRAERAEKRFAQLMEECKAANDGLWGCLRPKKVFNEFG